MSTQSSPGGKLSLEASVDSDDLIFGDDPRSLLAIPKAMMAKLSAQVNEGVQRLSPGGLEVGGLLVGPKVPGGRVVVDRIIALPIEYRFGPHFQMSVFDLPRIAAAIESVDGDPSKTVVGFYRSRSRDFRTLRESDYEILAAIEAAHKSFAADFRCCFILAPTSESAALACIAMRNGNNWDEMQPYTLGLNPPSITASPASTALHQLNRNLGAEEQATALPVPVFPVQAGSGMAQSTAPVEAAKPTVELPAANLLGFRRARIWMYAVSGLLALWIASVFLSGGKEQARPFPTLPENTAPRLGFSATFESPVWRLSWNRAAMDELKPVGAVLSIQDGAIQQQVPLAPADLSSGTIFYTPQGGDLNFGLRVDRGGSYAEEHVRVLGAPSASQPAPTKGTVAPAPNKQISVATPSNTVAAVAAPVVPAKPDPSPQETAKASPPDQEVKSLPAPAFQPTVMALATPVPPVIDPPRVVAPPPAPPAKSVTQPAKEPVKQLAAAPPAVTPPVIPPATSPAKSEAAAPAAVSPNPAAAAPAPAKSNYVGPRPIQQVSPQMPGNSSSDVSQVQVLVEIDVRGKVTKVTPIAWNARNAPMMAVAVRAASSWLFEPAQLNGHAVPSQMTLTFRINPLPAR